MMEAHGVRRKNKFMDFTGEYFIPGKSPKRIEDEHLERYKMAANFVQGKNALDIACGTGYGSKILAESGAIRVDGVDISLEAISYAKINYAMSNISFQLGDITRYKSNVPYQAIICFETIEHVEDYQAALSNLYSLLGKNGTLLISSPNRLITSPYAKSMNDKPINKFHIREFTIGELTKALMEQGFLVSKYDILGQRQRRYSNNRYVRKIYNSIFNPDERSSTIISSIKNLVPRCFIIVAKKT